MSKILALETSTETCSVALLAGAGLLLREERAGQRHSERILPMIDEVLYEAGFAPADLDGVAFGAGPGSFTGLRIACGVAQGLGFALDIPLLPVGTLLALAEACAAERVVACQDARMGEIYHGAYLRQEGRWCEISAPSLCSPDSAPVLPGEGWTGCGSGFDRYGERLGRRYAGQLAGVRPGLVPCAREIARLGAQALALGAGVPAERAAPLYVRDKVALKMHEQG